MKNKIKSALKKIERYSYSPNPVGMARSGRGRWVKYEDMMTAVMKAVTNAINEKQPEPSTNDDKPFEPGEIITFSDEDYVVIKNFGDSGIVKYFGDSDFDAFPFEWTFEGEKCRRANP